MEIIWTRLALSKIDDYIQYISRDHAETAEAWAEELVKRIDQLSDHPESGRMVPEFKDPLLRELIVGNYRVHYRISSSEKRIYIQTIRHVRQRPLTSSEELRR